MNSNEDIIVYTDGACLNNPGKGGWAAVIIENGEQIELSGGFRKTTNNRMEYLAAIKAMEFLCDKKNKIIIHTDSMLLFNTMSNWVFNWAKRGWKKADNKPIVNMDLVKRLYELSRSLNLKWVKVDAHKGVELNELCDQLAGQQAVNATEIDMIFENPSASPLKENLFEKQNIIKTSTKPKAAEIHIPEEKSDIPAFEQNNQTTILLENDQLFLEVDKIDNKIMLTLNSKKTKNKVKIPIDDLPNFIFTILKKYDE